MNWHTNEQRDERERPSLEFFTSVLLEFTLKTGNNAKLVRTLISKKTTDEPLTSHNRSLHFNHEGDADVSFQAYITTCLIQEVYGTIHFITKRPLPIKILRGLYLHLKWHFQTLFNQVTIWTLKRTISLYCLLFIAYNLFLEHHIQEPCLHWKRSNRRYRQCNIWNHHPRNTKVAVS